MKPGAPADCAPCIRVVGSQIATLVDERQKQFAVRRQIAFFRVDAPLQPSARLERIALCVPANDVKPSRRAPTEDNGFICVSREYHEQARGGFLVSHIGTRRRGSLSNSGRVTAAARSINATLTCEYVQVAPVVRNLRHHECQLLVNLQTSRTGRRHRDRIDSSKIWRRHRTTAPSGLGCDLERLGADLLDQPLLERDEFR